MLSQHNAIAAKVMRQSRSVRTDRSGTWLRIPGSVVPGIVTILGWGDLLGGPGAARAGLIRAFRCCCRDGVARDGGGATLRA